MLKNLATKQDFSMLTKKDPERNLLLRLPQRAGRGSSGRITMRHKGGGVKKIYRIIDFGQGKINIKGKVIALEYDPYRTAFIALIQYADNDKRYRIAPHSLKVGDEIICQDTAEKKVGNRMKLKNIPVGTFVHDVELEPGAGGKLARGAGTAAKVLALEGGYVHLQMPSSEIRKVFKECFASIGNVSRPEKIYLKLGKAGTSRHKGIRPTVRGTAMNPVDHPHGGGEGRTSIGMAHQKTPWGKSAAKGVKTRGNKKWTTKYILQRRSK